MQEKIAKKFSVFLKESLEMGVENSHNIEQDIFRRISIC